jgi:hypothetical protein
VVRSDEDERARRGWRERRGFTQWLLCAGTEEKMSEEMGSAKRALNWKGVRPARGALGEQL